jgi:phospholipase C
MRAPSLAALAGASVLLASCGGGGTGSVVTTVPPNSSATTAPGGTGSANSAWIKPPVAGSPIDHVIVIIQENRTVDDMFSSSFLTGGGPYPGANVVTTWTAPNNTTLPLSEVPFEYPADPDHSHYALLAEDTPVAGAPNYGFYTNQAEGVFGSPNPPDGFVAAYLPDFETILYHTLAYQYALADNMFSSRLVPSFPGHLFLIAGQSDPADDPTDPITWGCDSAPGTTVGVFSGPTGEAETLPGPFPCFNYLTLGDLMDRAGVSWRYYTGQIGNTVDGAVNTYDAIKHIRYGPDWYFNVVYPQTNILNDITRCNLPNVSYVTPPALASDHAGNLSAAGPGWVGSIYLAIAESQVLQKNPQCQYYGNTAILVTWDDSGGWYDHVTPPEVNGRSWGFRVPLIVASAWASHGSPIPFVSHVQRDFGSILKFIETNWSLGTLGQEDASADNLSDMFNYTQTPVPPIESQKVRQLIDNTKWPSVQNVKTNVPVDDDK